MSSPEVRNTENRPKQKISLTERIKRIPLFWKYLFMMGSVLLLSIAVLVLINRQYLKTLTNELMDDIQTNFQYDCDHFDERIYAPITLPSVIQQSRYYSYMTGPSGNELDLKYYPVLYLLRTAVQKQAYLTADAEDTLLYLKGYNSVVGSVHYEPVAEEYIGKYLTFSESDPDELLTALRARNSHTFIPLQSMVLNEKTGEYLCLILQPVNSSISVVSFYSRDTITRYLGISQFPEGSYWRFTGADGRVLASSGPESSKPEKGYTITGTLRSFYVQVDMVLPESFFANKLETSRSLGVIAILAVGLIGLFLAVFFSEMSVLPIQKMIRSHQRQTAPKSERMNELLRLDELLSTSWDNEKRMQLKLDKQILAKVFFGGILSEEEEQQMRRGIPYLNKSYQTVVLHTSSSINAILSAQFERVFPNGVWTMLNADETGLLLEGDTNDLNLLSQFVYTMNLQIQEVGIRAGVSAPCRGISDIYASTRQARRAVPAEPGLGFYKKQAEESEPVFWMQNQRLYQCVLNEDEDGALNLIDLMASNSSGAAADELFYVILFALKTAARELGVQEIPEEALEYHPTLSGEGNIRNLGLIIRSIFETIRDRKEAERGNRDKEILNFIRTNYMDSELTAASVAEEFGMYDRRVYDIVRNTTDKSFKEYLTDIRMKEAAKLLYSTTEDVSEIASKCGFNNSTTFYRQFRAYFGIAPGNFRKSGGPESTVESTDDSAADPAANS